MDDAAGMGRRQGVQDLLHDFDRDFWGQTAAALKGLVKAFALYVFHHQERIALVYGKIVQRHYIRMMETSDSAGLGGKSVDVVASAVVIQ